MTDDLRPATIAVTAGRPAHEPDQPLNVPITMASTYVAGGDLEYGRYGNPTWTAFEDALGALEGGRCLSFASGPWPRSPPCSTWSAWARRWSRPRTPTTAPCCSSPTSRPAAGSRPCSSTSPTPPPWSAACEDAALVWFESPTNPALEVADIPAIAAAAHEAGAYVVVDNTFATPLLQQPLDARRRHRRALGDQVPRRPQRRADGRDRHRRRAAVRRAQGPPRPDRRDPRAVRGLARAARPAHPAPARRAGPGQRHRAGRPAAPSTRRSARSATPASAASSRSCSPRARSRPTCSRTRPSSGCTRPRSAASSRPSSGAAAGRPSRPRSPTGWSGSRSASRTSRTSGPTCAGARRRWSVAGRTGDGSSPARRRPRTRLARRVDRRSRPASVRLGLRVAGDERVHHLVGGHPAGDDGVDVPGRSARRRRCARRARAATRRTSRPRRPGASRRRSRRWSCPWPSFSPNVRLRESGEEQVATRSPRPASPISVSGLAPSAIASRAVSARPRVITEAVVLSPKPRPTAMPTDERRRRSCRRRRARSRARRRWCRAGTPASGSASCSSLATSSSAQATTEAAGSRRAISLARLGPLITAIRSGPAPVTSRDHLAHPLQGAELDALHQRDERRVAARRTAPTR